MMVLHVVCLAVERTFNCSSNPSQKYYRSSVQVLFFYLDPAEKSPIESVKLLSRPGESPLSYAQKLRRWQKNQQLGIDDHKEQEYVIASSQQTITEDKDRNESHDSAESAINTKDQDSSHNSPTTTDQIDRSGSSDQSAAVIISKSSEPFDAANIRGSKLNMKPISLIKPFSTPPPHKETSSKPLTLQLPLSKAHLYPSLPSYTQNAVTFKPRIQGTNFLRLTMNTVSLGGSSSAESGVIQHAGQSVCHTQRIIVLHLISLQIFCRLGGGSTYPIPRRRRVSAWTSRSPWPSPSCERTVRLYRLLLLLVVIL